MTIETDVQVTERAIKDALKQWDENRAALASREDMPREGFVAMKVLAALGPIRDREIQAAINERLGDLRA